MNPQTERLLFRRMVEEMKRAVQVEPPLLFELQLTPEGAFCLIAQLQLAARHPGNYGAAAQVGRSAIDGLIAQFREAGYPAIAEAAASGDNPENDTPR